MNHISEGLSIDANREAIYNIYLYLAHMNKPDEYETFESIVTGLENTLKKSPANWKNRDKYRLKILKNAVFNDLILANSKICDLTISRTGLTACSFIKPCKDISVVFKGTASGEWTDNGKGLSGISEENTYITYAKRRYGRTQRHNTK